MMRQTIDVIGLGAGDMEQLPLGIYKKLIKAETPLFVRTKDHPVIDSLRKEGVQFHSFDAYYESEIDFHRVYERIVETLLQEAREHSIIYAVPGHPMLAEQTVKMLLEQTDVMINIVGGQSYLDDLFTALKIDPIEGFQFIDGTSFKRTTLQYEQHMIFCQVYDQMIASDIKLTLLEDLPADYAVTIVEAVGSTEEKILTVPLHELDHHLRVSNLTSIYVPPVPTDTLKHTFSVLRETIATLRAPNGCPWDREQTHESLQTYLIEEAYELIDAIQRQDDEDIIEELGDVLLQVMLHSQIGEDKGYFTIDDVIKGLVEKMIHRHPHVFNPDQSEGLSWDMLKKIEKEEQDQSILEGVPKHSPALLRAYELQKKAAIVGFEWEHIEDVWKNVMEEIDEVKEAYQNERPEEVEQEIGDVLFALANVARYYRVNPELALQKTNEKFISRFSYIEKKLIEQNIDIKKATLREMDRYWEEAKEGEKDDEIR